MSQLNDCRFDSLRAQGFTGATNDMLLAWAQAGGATLGQINDALLQYLQLNGATSGSLSDAWFEALRAAGYEGARNDMEMMFWCAGGTFGLTALRGWTDGVDCISDGNVVVMFSKELTFTETALPNGVTITHDNGGVFTIAASSGSGTNTSAYTGSWNVPITPSDTVSWSYDGTGDYRNVSGSVEHFNDFNTPDRDLHLYDETGAAWNEASLNMQIVSNQVTILSGNINSNIDFGDIPDRVEVDLSCQEDFVEIGFLLRFSGQNDLVRCVCINRSALVNARILLYGTIGGVGVSVQADLSNINIASGGKLIATDDGTTISLWLEGQIEPALTLDHDIPPRVSPVGLRMNFDLTSAIDNILTISGAAENLKEQDLVLVNCSDLLESLHIDPLAAGGGDGSPSNPFNSIRDLNGRDDVSSILIAQGTTHNLEGVKTVISNPIETTLRIGSYDAGHGLAKPIINSYITSVDEADWIEVDPDDGETPLPGSNLWWNAGTTNFWNPDLFVMFGSLDINGVGRGVQYSSSDGIVDPALAPFKNMNASDPKYPQYDTNNGHANRATGIWVYSPQNPILEFGTIYTCSGQSPVIQLEGDSYSSVLISDIKTQFAYSLFKVTNRSIDLEVIQRDLDTDFTAFFNDNPVFASTPSWWLANYLVENCKIDNMLFNLGVPQNALNGIIRNNDLFNVGLSTSSAGIYAGGSKTAIGSEFHIYGNNIDSAKHSRYWTIDGAGIMVDEGAKNIWAYGNFISNTHIVYKDNSGEENNAFFSNISNNCGILYEISDGSNHNNANTWVYNNTNINMGLNVNWPEGDDADNTNYDNIKGHAIAGVRVTGSLNVGISRVFNNIDVSISDADVRNIAVIDSDFALGILELDNNCFHNYTTISTDENRDPISIDPSNITTDPLVNPVTYELGVGSPAIGTGLRAFPPSPWIDFDGLPLGETPNMGAKSLVP